MRTCLILAVAGTLMLMAGVLLGAALAFLGQVPSGGAPFASLASAVLILAGLCCGVMLVAVSGRGDRRASARVTRQAPVSLWRSRTDSRPGRPAVGGRAGQQDGPSPAGPWPGSPAPR